MEELIPIAVFNGWTSAEIYRSRLLAEGLVVVIDHGVMNTMLGSFTASPGGIPLKVRADQAILALKILEDIARETPEEGVPYNLLF
jgi:hypothetical protein